ASDDLLSVVSDAAFVDGGVAVFGPSRAAARLEGSKVFAKEFMKRHNIPTARHLVIDNVEDAIKAVTGRYFGFPVVVKAEGLAAGKGVIIAEDEAQARRAIEDLLIQRKLG